MAAYYNEIEPFAAAWLRNLIAAGHIAPGDVDERSITDVQPEDLRGYTQVHLFAGIGGWSLAARIAGWPDDRPLWTGSCPCQPFSGAGLRTGTADARHLWPEMYRLVRECRPPVVAGEQVASRLGLEWLDGVSADLEAAGYAVGAADLCAAGVGAPHIRQRLYWLADAKRGGCESRTIASARTGTIIPPANCKLGGLGDASDQGLSPRERAELSRTQRDDEGGATGQSSGSSGVLADAAVGRRAFEQHPGGGAEAPSGREGNGQPGGGDLRPAPLHGFWRDADWLFCRDGKWRSVEPGTFPLAHGVPGRVGRLRAYGNAIVPQVAAKLLTAYIAEKG